MNPLNSSPIPIEGQTFGLHVAIGGLCVSATVLAVAALMRRRSEPLRYGILLTGVIGMLAVPVLVGVGRACQEALPGFATQVDDEVVKVPAEMLPELLNRPATAPPVESPLVAGEIIGAGLLALWILGTVIGVGRLLHALWKQSRALAGAPWRPAFWTDDRKTHLAHQLGLKEFPAVHLSPAVPMPMVIGIWRPTIVLPDPAPAAWEQPQWEAVLLHEAAHVARGDHWAVLAQRLAVTLFWWCPLVHLLARRLNELRENICDDCALQGTCDHIAYAELLVESAEHFLNLTALPVPLGLLNSARGGLEARVTRLLAKERPTMTRLSLSGKLLGAALIVAACLLTTAGTALSGGQAPPQKKIQIKIIVDGKEIDLADPQLLEHIEAAQKKAAVDTRIQAYKALSGLKPEQPTGAGGGAQPAAAQAAIGPDGKIIAFGDGTQIRYLDAVSGKIIGQVDPAKPEAPILYRSVIQAKPDAHVQRYLFTQPAQSKADPRIEELVKQAEAIKPGSGAEIRKALQALPKSGDPVLKDPKAVQPVRGTSSVRLWATDTGKKMIIIAIEDGKVLQLSDGDLKQYLEKGIRIQLDKDMTKQKADEKVRAVELLLQGKKAVPDKKAAPPAPAPAADVEALSRQLERLNAELLELRKRIEAGKK